MPRIRDTYTTEVDPARAAAIPAIQRAARAEAEEGHRILNRTYAEGIDDILSWLDGEQSHSLIGSRKIREAAVRALDDLDFETDPEVRALNKTQRERYEALVEHVGHDKALSDARKW